MELLKVFGDAHLDAYRFAQSEDFVDLRNDALSGIAEWTPPRSAVHAAGTP